MVNSNEFEGGSLYDAVRKATATYQNNKLKLEQKSSCRDLEIDLENFKRDAAQSIDRAEDLMREADALAESARREALDAVIGAAIAASGAFGSAARALRVLKGLRFRDMRRRDWLSLVPVVGGSLLAGASALNAVRDFQEARRLAREAQQESGNADRLGDQIVRIADEYNRLNCSASERIS